MREHLHHIVPRSRGGSNHPSNLIKLSAYDHALTHALDFLDGGPQFDFRHEGWLLLPDDIRQKCKEERAKRMREREVSDTTREKIGKSSRERMLAGLAAIAGSGNKGKPKSSAHKEKIRKANKGKPKPLLQCPHCGKWGRGHSAMSRWHFNNCRSIHGT